MTATPELCCICGLASLDGFDHPECFDLGTIQLSDLGDYDDELA